ncbi:hypothetical protein C0991_006471 [Blastosporella zonata]|nr:hypothetical protein C0991_006471 [Blastosporella zonata]
MMISVKYTLLLLSLVFASVPEAIAAPVGTRSVNVKAMRRRDTEREHMRRAHHSATVGSYVARDTIPVARQVDPAAAVAVPVAAREPIIQETRHEPHTEELPGPAKMTRRHHAKNEARGSTPLPRELPRFKRDVLASRKSDATDANVARAADASPTPTPTSTPTLAARHHDHDVIQTPTIDITSVPATPAPTHNAKRAVVTPKPLVDPAAPTPTGGNNVRREPDSTSIHSDAPAPTPDTKAGLVNHVREPQPEPVRPIRMFRRVASLSLAS